MNEALGTVEKANRNDKLYIPETEFEKQASSSHGTSSGLFRFFR
jgi:hypothetical protein